MAVSLEDIEIEVKLAIADLLLESLAGRRDVATQIFSQLSPKFGGRYPHEKVLRHVLFHAADAAAAGGGGGGIGE